MACIERGNEIGERATARVLTQGPRRDSSVTSSGFRQPRGHLVEIKRQRGEGLIHTGLQAIVRCDVKLPVGSRGLGRVQITPTHDMAVVGIEVQRACDILKLWERKKLKGTNVSKADRKERWVMCHHGDQGISTYLHPSRE